MKFYIYNPSPLDSCSNRACYRFHLNTRDPSHNFDCYRKVERLPINFQCSDRVHRLSEPHPRHLSRKYETDLWPWARTYISKKFNVSTRLDHLAAPIFRRVYTAKQKVESHHNVNDSVKQNLNLHIQRSMYNIYSRLQNVKFPNIVDSRRKSIKSAKLSAEEYENRLKTIERLSQPRKIPIPEMPAVTNVEKRPINMDVMERLSIPRKIKSPEQNVYKFPSRPIQSSEYYEKLSQPRKAFEDMIAKSKETEPKLQSMKRTIEMAAPLSRLQRRKYMKGDKEKMQFSVSRAALQYKASAKINKLAVPRQYPEDPNQRASKGSKKSKKKK